ncbi:MAG: hypothetical protein HQL23_01735 [Candidatus Omnitrophica bacterium]|nr:hypothetical protein [Candidatus Omnitrophota bacterium]
MITIALDILAAGLIFIMILFVLGEIFFYNYQESSVISRGTLIQQCPFCLVIFYCFRDTQIAVCPHCQSYLETGEGKYA